MAQKKKTRQKQPRKAGAQPDKRKKTRPNSQARGGQAGSDWRKRDPDYESERRKYDEPIPSRRFILAELSEAGEPLTPQGLRRRLGLSEKLMQAFEARLQAMCRQGELVENRRGALGPTAKLDLIRGTVIGHPEGFGFLKPDEGGDDVFLSPRQMRELLHGDRAVVRIRGEDRRGRPEGSLVEVLERANTQIVGRYLIEHGVAVVAPDNKRIAQDVLIPPDEKGKARAGQIVVAEIIQPPSKRSAPIGRIVEVLGDHLAPGMEIEVAIRAHGIPHQFPQAVIEESLELGDSVPESAIKGRRDLRKLPLVTIDGEDARDFDDAVFAEPLDKKGWRLWVAIADVATYVQPDSPLDQEAVQRGNSVYFPNRVVPMLPEALSNGLCSLNPEVDRLCMACEMEVSPDGKVKKARFHNAVLRSHARLTYTQVGAVLEGAKPEAQGVDNALLPHLQRLNEVYGALAKARGRRGAIDFDSEEVKFTFGKDGKIDEIIPVIRNRAHRLIEECMIAANVEAAKFLGKAGIAFLYRVHDSPAGEKIEDLRSFLNERGLQLGGGVEPDASHFAEVLKQVAGRDDAHLVQAVMLRSRNQAVYGPENKGHFGLALEEYAHFTSPIRRYPDLIVHRAIKHVLDKGSPKGFAYRMGDMLPLGNHCSMTERRADEATRDAVNWLKCFYLKDRIGEEFDAIVTGVQSFGLFAELEGIGADGLIHVTQLDNDYYHHDPARHALVGERSGKVHRLADRMRVKLIRVDLDDRKIDLAPVENEETGGKGQPNRRPDRNRGKKGKKRTSGKSKR